MSRELISFSIASTSDLNSPYSYVPTEWVCIILVVLFGISTGEDTTKLSSDITHDVVALHLIEAVWSRMWWLLPTAVLAGCGETIGWSGRLWSSLNIPDQKPFMMQ